MTSGSSPRRLYWDVCVFLDYLEKTPERIDVIDQVLAELAATDESRIYTSQLSVVEAAYTQTEGRTKQLDSEALAKLDDLWWRSPQIEVIEVNRSVTLRARELMRLRLSDGWSLKAGDAIHLATAQWINQLHRLDEIHTYDDKWVKFGRDLGLIIRAPCPLQSSFGI